MSRSGYSEYGDIDQWQYIMWRGAVASAIRGKRGQAFLRELLAAIDALPEKRLIAEEIQTPAGEFCALGCVGAARGVDLSKIDPWDDYHHGELASELGISKALVQEIEWMNDAYVQSPEKRFERVRAWVVENILEKPA